MDSITQSQPTTITRIARIPYLNSVPFYRGLALGEQVELRDLVPRALAREAVEGFVVGGPIPLVEFFRMENTFERVGSFGIAVRGRAHSAILFSRKPIRQLDGALISVTNESSTTACLLRILLERRYRIKPSAYTAIRSEEADALLLIGDEALQFQHASARYPFEIDLALEWWLWQSLPFVFAVWLIRKDASSQLKRNLRLGLSDALGRNLKECDLIAQEHSNRLGITEAELEKYIRCFVYRLSGPEENAISRFRELMDECGLI